MAFNPRSDIVLEVVNAADPSRASMAAERLAALGAANAPAGNFAADLSQVAAANARAVAPVQGLANARDHLAQVAAAPDQMSRAKVEFEATMLNSFVSELLPKDPSNMFGEGAAGDMWRSMLSEQISRQIAKSGALGLSRRLFATHELAPHGARGPGVHATDPAEMSANILSAPSTSDVVNDAILSAGRKHA